MKSASQSDMLKNSGFRSLKNSYFYRFYLFFKFLSFFLTSTICNKHLSRLVLGRKKAELSDYLFHALRSALPQLSSSVAK